MSLLPLLFDDSSRLFDQHFGLGMDLEDLSLLVPRPNLCTRHYYRPWRTLVRADTGSKISHDKDKYQITLDVQHFKPEEITVKTVGNEVVVEGKHEEKQDEHGFISRHFVRKYQLPEGYKVEQITSSLSSDGVLSISAPKPQSAIEEKERVVPVAITGPTRKGAVSAGKGEEVQKMEQ